MPSDLTKNAYWEGYYEGMLYELKNQENIKN